MTSELNEKIKGLDSIINIDRPAGIVDLSGLLPEPIDVPVVFVVGSPRSGTTALGNVLGANSLCSSADESMFLLSMWLDFDELVLGNNRRKSTFLGSYTTPQKALGYMSEYIGHFYKDLMATKSTAKYVVDHTPWNSHIFEFINLIFPKAIFLHIIRDEAQVVSSLRRIKEAGGDWGQDTDNLRVALRKHMVKVSQAISKTAPDRYFEISYQDFCNTPAESLEPFFRALGLE